MKKTNIAIVGYGNIGKGVYEAALSSPDIEIAGVVLRDVSTATEKGVPSNLKVVSDVAELGDVDVAMLCIPSRFVPSVAEELLAKGINTVDSYDIHGDIFDVQQRLTKVAKQGKAVSILSAGWDPGTDSIVRCLLEVCAPKGLTYTNFGPGMSMGHTVAVKAIDGVKNALSVTIPIGTGLHRRMVYVDVHNKSDFPAISTAIKNDPYFINDETHVMLVDDIDALKDMGHGVNMTRKGVSGVTHNQLFEFNMRICNPALTAQIMLASGRATMRQAPGCYTMIEIPIIDFLAGEREDVIRRLV